MSEKLNRVLMANYCPRGRPAYVMPKERVPREAQAASRRRSGDEGTQRFAANTSSMLGFVSHPNLRYYYVIPAEAGIQGVQKRALTGLDSGSSPE